VPFIYKVKSTGKAMPVWATPDHTTRRTDVADWTDAYNVRQPSNDNIVFTR
jgi:hypothetical protein